MIKKSLTEIDNTDVVKCEIVNTDRPKSVKQLSNIFTIPI